MRRSSSVSAPGLSWVLTAAVYVVRLRVAGSPHATMVRCMRPCIGSIVALRRSRPRRRSAPGAALAPHALPPVDAKADYQLGGSYPLPDGVRVVSRDRTDRRRPPGAYNICYVNAFQTQPGQLRWWREHHPGLLLRDHGELVRDPGWPGEVLLDTSTPRKRRGIAAVVGRWIDRLRRRRLRRGRARQPRLVHPVAAPARPAPTTWRWHTCWRSARTAPGWRSRRRTWPG